MPYERILSGFLDKNFMKHLLHPYIKITMQFRTALVFFVQGEGKCPVWAVL